MKFTEAKFEKVFTELLGNEGYPHHLGITINRPPFEVYKMMILFTRNLVIRGRSPIIIILEEPFNSILPWHW